MSKKILLITSVIFLSSCAATNIQELGDKFLDLINPSDAPAEVADLSEQVLVLSDERGSFTEEELETLSNDKLIEKTGKIDAELMKSRWESGSGGVENRRKSMSKKDEKKSK